MGISLSRSELAPLWAEIKEQWKSNLASEGVELPQFDEERPSTRAITLILLYKYMGQVVSKADLTRVVRGFNPEVNDVQEGRHLGPQRGFMISSGRRGDKGGMKSGEYRLENLTEVYPEYSRKRRDYSDFEGWDSLLHTFANRCASCGSKDGEPHLINNGQTTRLHKGHMDPTEELTIENLIPQCESCNQAYQDKFIFDKNGRVRDINIESRWWAGKYRRA